MGFQVPTSTDATAGFLNYQQYFEMCFKCFFNIISIYFQVQVSHRSATWSIQNPLGFFHAWASKMPGASILGGGERATLNIQINHLEIHMSPEKGPFQKEKSLPVPSFLRGIRSFSGE